MPKNKSDELNDEDRKRVVQRFDIQDDELDSVTEHEDGTVTVTLTVARNTAGFLRDNSNVGVPLLPGNHPNNTRDLDLS